MTSRRGFLIGIGAALAAPAIVKAESLMKIAALRESLNEHTITKLFIGPISINPTRLVMGTAWQAIIANGGNVEIVEFSPEDIYAKAP
jgi:hypothetical protein